MADPTFSFYQKHGAPGTETEDNTLRLSCSSGNDPGVNYSVPIQTGITARSYVMVIAPGVTAMNDASSITDWELYFDAQGTVEAALGTGVSLKIGDQEIASGEYTEATGTGSGPTRTGTLMTTLYSGIITTMSQCYTYVTGSRKSLTTVITTGTGPFTKFQALQLEVEDTAAYGQAGPINCYAACLVA